MKKKLTLIRHAKSSWGNPHLPDYERVLNERGQGDAVRMGKALQQRDINFERVLCSSATRARETLNLLREQLVIEEDAIDYLDDLYCASVATLINIIQQADNSKTDLAIIAHNPGLEELAAHLTKDAKTFSTCTVMQIEFEIDSWRQIDETHGQQSIFLSPKTLQEGAD